jgi:DNA-binding GntR family transcriptional regulator
MDKLHSNSELLVSSSKPSALADWAYTTIKASILNFKIPPGTQMHVDQLADQMGTSRTPIREALLRLERDGLVRVSPRVGFFVTEVTKQDLAELFELREMLESRATRQAAANLTKDDLAYLDQLLDKSEAAVQRGDLHRFLEIEIKFHTFLVQHAQNRHLAEMMGSLRDLTYRERIISLESIDNVRASLAEHRKVVEALHAADAALAARLMSEHICAARDRILQFADLP